MKLIPIYSAEASVDGLAEKIRANSSIAYHSKLAPSILKDEVLTNALAQFSKASVKSVQDLFPTESILATTSWNKNDDIFSVIDTWNARATPINKPTNLNHSEAELVGHMTGTWAIDTQGNVIPDSTNVDELPDRFHLCNSAVIYNHWQDETLKSRTAKLIEEIQAGTKYVSMECFFCNFDYGVISSSGEFYIVPRDKSTAFLTKHLRAYEGSGEYEGYQVGRVMREFVFSGKGYVDEPANPESIIFANAKCMDFSKVLKENPFNNGVGVSLSYQGITKASALVDNKIMEQTHIMSDSNNDVLIKQLEEVKAALKASENARAELVEKTTKAEAAKWEAQIADLTTKLEAAKKDKEADMKSADKAKADAEATMAKLAEAEKAKAELEKVVADIKAEQARASRVSTLVEGGMAKTDAEVKVSVFANLNDEQFKVIANEIISVVKSKMDATCDDEKKKKDAAAAVVAAELALKNAKANTGEVAPVVSADENAELVEARKVIASRLINNKNNKK